MFSLQVSVISAIAVFSAIPLVSCQSQPESECPADGIQCSSDCTRVEYCMTAGSTPLLLTSCDSGAYCQKFKDASDRVTANCSSTNVCSSGGGTYAFKCPGFGSYPDPFNCATIYQCSGANKSPDQQCSCPEGTHFDTASHQCKSTDTEKCCRTPPACNRLGQTGCLGKACTDDVCYICTMDSRKFIPQLIKCPQGIKCEDTETRSLTSRRSILQGFDTARIRFGNENVRSSRSNDPQCTPYVPPSSGGNEGNPTTPTTPPTEPTTAPTPTTPTTPPTDPTTPPTPTTPTTPPTDPTSAPTPTTPTTPPTEPTTAPTPTTPTTPPTDPTTPPTPTTPTTPPTDPTVTPAPTTPTTPTTEPTTPTTTSTTARPAPTCSYPGQLMTDSTDCRSYYRCSSALRPDRKTCPTGYRFSCNPTCGCVKGTCS